MLRLSLILALSLVSAPATLASTGTYGGEGAVLFPLKKTPIHVLSQHISLEDGALARSPAPGWRVQAVYTLENPTDQPVTVELALPEFACRARSLQSCALLGARGGSSFLDLRTWVGFKEVKLGKGRAPRGVLGGRAVRRVHTFKVSFAPREVQKVRNTYRFGRSTHLGSERIAVVTRPGSLWSGPIGKAIFAIRTLARPYAWTLPAELKVLSYTQMRDPNHGDVYLTDLVLEGRDWRPSGDVVLEQEPAGSVPLLPEFGCPPIDEVVSEAGHWIALSARAEPAPFRAMSDAELRRCRELPRAVYGYGFDDPELTEFFYESHPVSPGAARFVARSSAEYEPWMLTNEEWLYMRVLEAVEAARSKP